MGSSTSPPPTTALTAVALMGLVSAASLAQAPAPPVGGPPPPGVSAPVPGGNLPAAIPGRPTPDAPPPPGGPLAMASPINYRLLNDPLFNYAVILRAQLSGLTSQEIGEAAALADKAEIQNVTLIGFSAHNGRVSLQVKWAYAS